MGAPDVPLREHFETLLAEQEKRYAQRFDAQEKAIAVAEANAEKWRANANEWRQAMTDRERNFLPRSLGHVIGVLSALSLAAALFAGYVK